MASAKQPTLGILGTGHLATYTVTGLRRSADPRSIVVSARNAERAKHLATNFACQIAQDNQAVIDQADVILLAVRPWQLEQLVSDLHFPAGKIVVSAIAGLSLKQLRSKATFPEKLALILPMVAAENAKGYVPIHPNYPELKQLADSLGKTIVFEEESQFEQAAAMTCLHGWLYRFFDEQTSWLTQHGIDADSARQLGLHNTLGAAHYALGCPDQSLQELTSEIARDDTYTKLGLDKLESEGAFTQWSKVLTLIKDKLDSVLVPTRNQR